ncbi:UNVERIFIED_CONTAM: hypothetical protein H355_005169 [Colinus virginianus]|nr:hypothetical protein H355_005169 [Colinus virginianus]
MILEWPSMSIIESNAVKPSLALHPQKDVVVTASDDRLWKMWALPDGDIITVGEGHTDWVSGCCFHPSGTRLVTSSGDATVRIWDLSKGECVLNFKGHTQAVWDCSWHSCGDFVASASKDSTSKIWDVNSERCRYTLRGHKDSVSSIEFLLFSNTVLTSSADKTLSLWDARMRNDFVSLVDVQDGSFKKSSIGSLWFVLIHCTSGSKIEVVTPEDEEVFHENFEAVSVMELLGYDEGMCKIKSTSWHEV